MSLNFYIYVKYAKEDADTISEVVPDTSELDVLEYVFWSNITHNLGPMAVAADLYDDLWRPGYTFTSITPEVISRIERGYEKLKDDPEMFSKKYDSPNGWGVYEHFVPFVRDILQALREYPNGYIFRSV